MIYIQLGQAAFLQHGQMGNRTLDKNTKARSIRKLHIKSEVTFISNTRLRKFWIKYKILDKMQDEEPDPS